MSERGVCTCVNRGTCTACCRESMRRDAERMSQAALRRAAALAVLQLEQLRDISVDMGPFTRKRLAVIGGELDVALADAGA